MENKISRLILAYYKGKEQPNLEKEIDLEARAFGNACIAIGSISDKPIAESSMKKLLEYKNKAHEKALENYKFPKNYVEKLAYNIGYNLAL